MNVVFAVEAAVREIARPDKINLASLGNVVPHLHWHVIPRWADDPHFPDAIWAAPRRASRAAGRAGPISGRVFRRGWRTVAGCRNNPFNRKTGGKRAALAGNAVDAQSGLMPLQHMLDDRQAEPGSAVERERP
jgi:hypothetical protein